MVIGVDPDPRFWYFSDFLGWQLREKEDPMFEPLFHDFFTDGFWKRPAPPLWKRCMEFSESTPRWRRDGDRLFVEFDVPGVKKENVKVVLQSRQLYVSWKRQDQELSFAEYVGDVLEAQAQLEDGVLTISLLAPEEKRVEVPVE